ncbi:MAG: methyl-accepting chemotaxis protein [Nitrospirae bacterium]|nr:methyl-accepting chemotaxis protein [Nitrospirota bacterium]
MPVTQTDIGEWQISGFTVGKKLVLAFGALGMLALVMGITTYMGILKLKSDLTNVVSVQRPAVDALGRVEAALKLEKTMVEAQRLNPAGHLMGHLQELRDATASALSETEGLVPKGLPARYASRAAEIVREAHDLSDELLAQISRLGTAQEEIAALSAEQAFKGRLGAEKTARLQSSQQEASELSGKIERDFAVFDSKSTEILAAFRKELTDTLQETIQANDRDRVGTMSSIGIIVLVLLLATLVLAVVCVSLLRKMIVRPVQDLTDAAFSIRQGDLAKRVEARGSDEFSILARSLNDMVEQIGLNLERERERSEYLQAAVNHVLERVQAVGEGDLTQRVQIESEDEMGQLSRGINDLLTNLSALIGRVSKTAALVGTVIKDIVSASEQVSMAASGQNSQAGEVAQAVAELSSSIQLINRTVEGAVKITRDTHEKASLGGKSMHQMEEAMLQIKRAVEDTASRIEELGRRGKEIGKIVEVISGIAEQTNLLSLNAAIEAARAGEQGKGFAVVADQVSNLAERAAKSTEEISNLIEQVQVDTDESVRAMRLGSQEVEKGTQVVRSAVGILEEIVGGVTSINSAIEDISKATTLQTSSANQVAKRMDNIVSAAEETVKVSQSTLNQTKSLQDDMLKLETAISHFQVDGQGPRALAPAPSNGGGPEALGAGAKEAVPQWTDVMV